MEMLVGQLHIAFAIHADERFHIGDAFKEEFSRLEGSSVTISGSQLLWESPSVRVKKRIRFILNQNWKLRSVKGQ